jgi:hypothetical protein
MGDPGHPTITCAIGPHVFTNTFCDLGASINVMSKVIYDQILDFAILDMGHSKEVPLLLGRPFLYTTSAELHVGTGHAHFYIQGKH